MGAALSSGRDDAVTNRISLEGKPIVDLFIHTIMAKMPRAVLTTLILGKQQVWEGRPAGLAYGVFGSERRFQENEWNTKACSAHFNEFHRKV